MYVGSKQMVLPILPPDPNQSICLDVMYAGSKQMVLLILAPDPDQSVCLDVIVREQQDLPLGGWRRN